jgi:endonuclease-8
VPEGDTIHFAAGRIRAVLEGHVPDEILTPHPRFARDRWPERLAARRVTGVDAVGKHLLIRCEGGLVIHSHLRMHGSWAVIGNKAGTRPGEDGSSRSGSDARPRLSGPDLGKAPLAGAWLVIRHGDALVIQRHGPVLELTTAARLRLDPRLYQLGPDIVAEVPFDQGRFLRRLRADDPTRPIGDALLDQRTVAGIGNFWKVEACFLAGIDPWRPVGEVNDEEVLSIVAGVRPRMQASARDGRQSRFRQIYGKAGSHCPRCGPPVRILSRGQGDENRITYWCPSCQR